MTLSASSAAPSGVLKLDHEAVDALIRRWRDDPGGTYRSWFLWEERTKNFRSIRRGIEQVVREMEADTFGVAYKGSSLETVVGSIAEQRQMFKGADHAFLWKPKLRIPDIYEDRENQLAFARMLEACRCCNTEEQVLTAIRTLAERGIKGLGPAAANLLYFLHPTIAPPFNTAIVNGYNALTGAKVKLGKWDQYLAMREGILALNAAHRNLLSNDLGAVAGLLFDLGTGRYAPPPLSADATAEARAAWEADLAQVRADAKVEKARAQAEREDVTHTEVQGWLRDLGRALGFHVWIAANDRNRQYQGARLADGCLIKLPATLAEGPAGEAISLIDVLWLEPEGKVAAAFEVEHTTSIYSGIVRMLDLALSGDPDAAHGMYLVAPDAREDEVRAQIRRPAFSRVADLRVRYLPYGELRANREAIMRFGRGLHPIEALARDLG
ncbi:type II restriction endonuclease [Streptomyces longwoodensis]|uniref:type II restriction endonuclease n=1 Tax=Streptomyces longwoodensis TaxID=68231 RepID=UPI0036E51AFA